MSEKVSINVLKMRVREKIIVLDIDNLMYFPLPRIELPVYEKAA